MKCDPEPKKIFEEGWDPFSTKNTTPKFEVCAPVV